MAKSEKQIKVTQVKSIIGATPYQKKVLEGLGLHRMNHSVILPDNSAVRGACEKIDHMVKIEEL